MLAIINRDDLETAAACVCMAYEKTAPTVSEWADWLYQAKDDAITLEDLFVVQEIANELPQPNYAANRVYHLLERQGKATVGQAGF